MLRKNYKVLLLLLALSVLIVILVLAPTSAQRLTIVSMYLLAFIVGFTYRAILKKFAPGSVRGVAHNIGKQGRLLRAIIGIGLLLWAITTTWSPLLIFFSGFAFFEAIVSWCGLYAAIGKNTCPIE